MPMIPYACIDELMTNPQDGEITNLLTMPNWRLANGFATSSVGILWHCGIAGFVKGFNGQKHQETIALSAAYGGFL